MGHELRATAADEGTVQGSGLGTQGGSSGLRFEAGAGC